MNPIDPESLIYRFAKQLEFGSAMMQVASEAVRIVQRMNRDWMTTGRRPAGICGAALILAARMNNFRRTVREVVYVVKVTEITINQRLNEFSATESGDLTVDQFRSVQLESAHDPPAFIRAREEKKPGRGRKRKAAETAAEIEGDVSESNSNNNSTPDVSPPPTQTRRVDADGFAIPDPPIDPALIAEDANRRRSITSAVNEVVSEVSEQAQADGAAKPKRKRSALPQPTAEQIASEEALENEMTELLSKESDMVKSAMAPAQAAAAAAPAPRKPVSDAAEIDASEFDSDPEVANCLLSPAEVEIKERIWVHENKDYLRTQQAKALKRALAEAAAGPGAKAKPRKRRKGRLGDVRYLEGEEDEEGRSTRATTPAEATRRMLEKRGFSKKINYRLLETLYGEEGAEEKPKEETESITRRSQSIISRRSASVEPEAARRRSRLATPAITTAAKPAIPAATTAAPAAAAAPKPKAPGQPTPAPTPPATAAAEKPKPQPRPQQPLAPNEEILGPAPGQDEQELRRLGHDPAAYSDEDEEEDLDDEELDEEEDEEENDDPDGIEAAFAGRYHDYYDDESDYGSD